jgi:hypothetical protein
MFVKTKTIFMTKSITVIILIGSIILSCKKVKIERLTIGDQSKMEITDLNIEVNTSETASSLTSNFVEFPINLDGDGSQDVILSLQFMTDVSLPSEEENFPWRLSIEILNNSFSIREMIGSNEMYRKISASGDTTPEGVPIELYEFYLSCAEFEGSSKFFKPPYILSGQEGGKFTNDDNGRWTNESGSSELIVAESPSKLYEWVVEQESETLNITEKYSYQFNCDIIDISKPIYIQFKTVGEDARFGWIELIFDENSFLISRVAISKRIVVE